VGRFGFRALHGRDIDPVLLDLALAAYLGQAGEVFRFSEDLRVDDEDLLTLLEQGALAEQEPGRKALPEGLQVLLRGVADQLVQILLAPAAEAVLTGDGTARLGRQRSRRDEEKRQKQQIERAVPSHGGLHGSLCDHSGMHCNEARN